MSNDFIGGIRRGRMAADQFTIVANLVHRDPRITLGAKGLFGNLASHKEGFPITEKLVKRQCADSLFMIRKYMSELCTYGYLYRGPRERYPAGTVDQNGKPLGGKLGPHTYFVTDQPDEIAQILAQNEKEAEQREQGDASA